VMQNESISSVWAIQFYARMSTVKLKQAFAAVFAQDVTLVLAVGNKIRRVG
jgi:hypothetical protein